MPDKRDPQPQPEIDSSMSRRRLLQGIACAAAASALSVNPSSPHPRQAVFLRRPLLAVR